MKTPLNLSIPYCRYVERCQGGALIAAPWCRETWESRTAVRSEKSFRNLIKSNRNQIVSTIIWLIWKMVNTIWFPFYLIRFRKDFSVCETSGSLRWICHGSTCGRLFFAVSSEGFCSLCCVRLFICNVLCIHYRYTYVCFL